MTSGKYFNKGVMALDAPHIGHVVRETKDKIAVFGEGDDRYDIPKSAIRFASRNVLIDLPFYEIVRKYKVSRDEPLPMDSVHVHMEGPPDYIDLATYEGKYPKSLFNRGVRTQDEENVGHVMKETDNMIVVWGHYDWRFDIPKSKIIAVGRNVILGMDYQDVFQYRVDREAPLPTGEPIETLASVEVEQERVFEEGSAGTEATKIHEDPLRQYREKEPMTPAKVKEHEPTAVKREMEEKIVSSAHEQTIEAEDREKAKEIARSKGMAKGTAGAARTGTKYEQGTSGTNE